MPSKLLPFLALLAFAGSSPAQSLGPLAEPPDWRELDQFQEVITRDEFERLLREVYAPGDAARGLITVDADRATIVRSLGVLESSSVRFARDESSRKPAPGYWRLLSTLPDRDRAARPLQGWRIALDPGHLGGGYARMEGRWFRIGQSVPVTEGDMTLRTAEHLAVRLSKLGATVLWVRDSAGPTTRHRPADFFSVAFANLAAQGITQPRLTYSEFEDPGRAQTLQNQAEHLFYRTDEIRHRARRVNEELKPDVVLCLHFNAEAWGPDASPELVTRNHFHVLVNGAYSATELRLDDQRHDMLMRLLGGITGEEHRLSTHVARAVAREMALPPWIYTRDIARRVNDNPYVWARNLLANRLYRCPVVFLEPYVMNSQEIWERVQAGDYEGERLVAGSVRRSIYREYADAVTAGLVNAAAGKR